MLIGNDVLVNLNVDKENLFLVNDLNETISFTVSVLTNPFCEANCNYFFDDLSENKTIDQNSFVLKTTSPYGASYNLFAPSEGEGQKLYRFDINCTSKNNFLCHTSNELKTGNKIITLNYKLNSEKVLIKDQVRKFANYLFNRVIYSDAELNASIQKALEFNETISADYLMEDVSGLNKKINSSYSDLTGAKSLWTNIDYSGLAARLLAIESSFNVTEEKISSFASALEDNISFYNTLVENLTTLKNNLVEMQKNNFTNVTRDRMNDVIDFYGVIIDGFSHQDSLQNKIDLVLNLSLRIEDLKNVINLENDSERLFISNKNINNASVGEIAPINFSVNALDFIVDRISYSCCFEGKCENCCNDSCYGNSNKFPVIFVHGHDFSQSVSAEYAITRFDEMQRYLENYGYINFGSFLPTDENSYKGIWGTPFEPISIRVSYYFDVLQYTDKKVIVQTKTDNLDSYAIRLNEIIDAIRYKTNRDKVNIVATSMGGLVTRRYMQLFGDDKIDKFIMIATPNHGISGTTLSYCGILGAQSECSDMNENSLFINKLNNGVRPSVPIYNIIGNGCDTSGENGDGVVKNSSAYLDFATNYYVQGNCNSLVYLHNELIKPSEYPDVFKIVVDALKK